MPGLLDTFKQKATAVKDYLYPPAPNGMSLWEYAQQRANDPLQPNLSSRITQQDLVNKGLNLAGLAPVGMVGRAKTKYEIAHDIASKNAEKMLGLPKGNTYIDRAKALGAIPSYHGTVDDVKNIDPKMFGKSTGAHSAKRAFWAVDDPRTARGYAEYAANEAPIKRLLDEADTYERIAQKNQGAYANKYFDKYDDTLAKAEALQAEINANSLRGQNVMPLMIVPKRSAMMDAKGAEFVDVEGGVNNFLRQAKGEGADLGIINNLADDVGLNARPATHYAALDPSIVRSRFAAFDPARLAESDLLAGLAPYFGVGGLLGLGMYGNQDRMTD